MMPESKETRCSSSRTWRGRGIRRVYCRKTGQAQTHPHRTATHPRKRPTLLIRPLPRRWWLQGRPLQVPANSQQAGSRDTLLKVEPTLSTTILAQPRGSTPDGNSTSGCTVDKTLAETTPPSSSSPSRNLDLFQVVGKCASPTPPESTSLTTTRRLLRGMILVYRHLSTRTCHSTSVTSGESLFTSVRSLLYASCLASATSRSGDLISSRTHMRRSCVKVPTISRRG